MKHIISITTITCFLMGLTVDAQGADKQEYTIVGVGSQSCSTFAISRDKTREFGLPEDITPPVSWLTGFLTATTLFEPRIRPIIEADNVKDYYHWMINYCQQHPLDKFSDGAVELLRELINRSINAPANIPPRAP